MMKNLLFSLGFCVAFLSSGYGQSTYDSIYFDGGYRYYLLHLPTGYDGTTPLSLIVGMHGGFGWATQFENQSQLSVKSDAEGFIVVYPEGVKSPAGIRTWNAGWCCGYASNNNIDDVGFLGALLDTLIANYAVDEDRIYATGMSNGGYMSYRLACEMTDRIAAIAPVAASMSMTSCTPTRPVPIIAFHSYQDTNVPYQGGIGSGFSNHYSPPQDSVMNAWSVTDNCNNTSDTLVNDSQYTHVQWTNCDCNYEIQYYITQDGGHSWPGGTQTSGGDPVSQYINADDLMWDFFQLHSLTCPPTGIDEDETVEIKLYPNPSGGKFTIEGDAITAVIVYTVDGKVVNSWNNLNPMTIESNKVDIDLSNEKPGMYFVEVQTNGSKTTIKLNLNY